MTHDVLDVTHVGLEMLHDLVEQVKILLSSKYRYMGNINNLLILHDNMNLGCPTT